MALQKFRIFMERCVKTTPEPQSPDDYIISELEIDVIANSVEEATRYAEKELPNWEVSSCNFTV